MDPVLIGAICLVIAALIALRDLFTRTDIGWGKKGWWVLAIVVSLGVWPAIYGAWDLYSRTDIGRSKKAMWIAAFVVTAGIGLVLYGCVAFSQSSLVAGGDWPAPRSA